MALWLLCCVLLFITSRGYDWLSHQSWFWAPELSLPWLLLGGLGLAIASNRRAWPWPPVVSRVVKPSSAATPGSPTEPSGHKAIAPPPGNPPLDEVTMKAVRPASAAIAQKSSISFKIPPPKASTDG